MVIGTIAKPGSNNRLLLRRLPPFLHTSGGWLGQEPRLAQQRLDGIFHLIPQAIDDALHPFNTFRTARDFFKTVPNGLRTRNVGCRPQYRREKPRWLAWCLGGAVRIAFAKSKTGVARFWVDIDKAAVHFAPRWPVAQGGNCLVKRRIG